MNFNKNIEDIKTVRERSRVAQLKNMTKLIFEAADKGFYMVEFEDRLSEKNEAYFVSLGYQFSFNNKYCISWETETEHEVQQKPTLLSKLFTLPTSTDFTLVEKDSSQNDSSQNDSSQNNVVSTKSGLSFADILRSNTTHAQTTNKGKESTN